MTMSNSTTESASRIPVTTALRRSSSLRQKGERCYQHGPQQQAQVQGQEQQQQQQPFPAINENAPSSYNKATARPLALICRRSNSSSSLRGGGGGGECDVDSVRSYGGSSNCSQYSSSSTCEHAHFGFNGTTWSARSRRYIVHCSPRESRSEAGSAVLSAAAAAAGSPENYLTPTQRAARQLRNLQTLLKETRQRLDQRDREIARLTQELVELRLFKAAASGSQEDADADADDSANDKPPLQEQQQQQQQQQQQASPLVDSGHFDDGSSSQRERNCHFERRIDEMQRRHTDELQQLKQSQHDRLEGLLNQLADLSARYCDAQPAVELAKARSRQLEAELRDLSHQLQQAQALLAEHQERNKQTYLELYAKGQQSTSQSTQSSCSPDRVSLAELLQQLAVTQAELNHVKDSPDAPERLMALACRSQSLLSLQEAISLWVLATRKAMYRSILESRNKQNALDPEITLQFLKSAIYYFLTDKDNLHGHLNAIESILGFTDSEKLNIDRIYRSNKK